MKRKGLPIAGLLALFALAAAWLLARGRRPAAQPGEAGAAAPEVSPGKGLVLPAFRTAVAQAKEDEELPLVLCFADEEAASRFLASAAVRLTGRDGRRIACLAPKALAAAWLDAPPEGIEFLQPEPRARLFNTVAAGDRFLGLAALRTGAGLDGRGEIIAVLDTGLSTGVASTLHGDLLPALYGMTVEPSVTNASTATPADLAGHGTHVAGSAVSRGTKYSATKGMAPGAALFFQRIGTNAYGDLALNATNDSAHFQRSRQAGASILSCSWGRAWDDEAGTYDTFAQSVDEFVWNNPEMLVCFAVGNEGEDLDEDGVIDENSIYSLEAQAKNVVTVGAQESYRPTNSSTYTIFSGWTFGSAIRADRIARPADYASASDPGHDGMAAFSSRGPLADGRIAPMLVAPGTAIASTSKAGGSTQMSGSSMATPVVAGGAAVFRQYLREAHAIAAPTAALVRAGLILCCDSLAPGQYGEGETREIPAESPNNVEGWGALHLGRHLDGAMTFGFRDRIALKRANASQSFTIPDVKAGSELVAVLSWIDAPWSSSKLYMPPISGGRRLVNDYDLTLTAPDGETFTLGDRTNPVERLRIASAKAGDYTLTVTAKTIRVTGSGNLAAVAWRAETEGGPSALPAPPAAARAVTLTVRGPDGAEPYVDFPLWPAPGAHAFAAGERVQCFGGPKLARSSFSAAPETLWGWSLRKADGSLTMGTTASPAFTLDQDATLRWWTAAPGFRLRLR